jgi:sugar phosphate isomerase/epimerase
MCNETFKQRRLEDTCKAIRNAGYTGVEIAPFTLTEDPVGIPIQKRREYSSIIRSEGLTFVGLHWLLLAPKGLHITTPDRSVRERSWQHMRRLIDLCCDLGPGGTMVLGSPQQRGATGGLSVDSARKNLVEGLAGIAPHAAERGVKVLVETFSTMPTDVARTLDEAVAIVRQIGSPGIQTMFDTGNTIDEVSPPAALVDRYFDFIRHIHIKEPDGPYPGVGSYDFKPVLGVLRRRGYAGWLSLELDADVLAKMDFNRGPESPEHIAQSSLRYVETEIAKLD